jgi:ribosomal protein S18 acetylase RimI-like enzyme
MTTPSARARTAAARFSGRVRFRPATADDVPALTDMINEAYMREAWLLAPPRTREEELRAALAKPETRLFCAEVSGELAGSILVRLTDDPFFWMLAVSPGHQGRGLASLLVSYAEAAVRDAGAAVLRLDCARELGLVPFYESLGYDVERVTPDTYLRGRGPVTLVVMKKDLR